MDFDLKIEKHSDGFNFIVKIDDRTYKSKIFTEPMKLLEDITFEMNALCKFVFEHFKKE